MRNSGMKRPLLFRLLLLAAVAGLLAGCGRLPKLTPAPEIPCAESTEACLKFFPQKPWRAVHALHISGPFGQQSSVMGITVVDPVSRRMRAVILSVEGIVLFDASYDRGVPAVHRAIPPLDRKGFPEGLLHDVSLMFLAPEGAPDRAGIDDEGLPVCRWGNEGSGATDVVIAGQDRRRILQYGPDNTLQREADLEGRPGEALARTIRFSCRGLTGYGLDLTLVEWELLTGGIDSLFSP